MSKGDDGKKDGMRRAAKHANPVWRRYADEAVLKAARIVPKLTTDDIVLLIPEGITTHENRALGPVMRAAAKDGIIEKDRTPNVMCATRPSNHSRPLQVWRSLLYRAGPP